MTKIIVFSSTDDGLKEHGKKFIAAFKKSSWKDLYSKTILCGIGIEKKNPDLTEQELGIEFESGIITEDDYPFDIVLIGEPLPPDVNNSDEEINAEIKAITPEYEKKLNKIRLNFGQYVCCLLHGNTPQSYKEVQMNWINKMKNSETEIFYESYSHSKGMLYDSIAKIFAIANAQSPNMDEYRRELEYLIRICSGRLQYISSIFLLGQCFLEFYDETNQDVINIKKIKNEKDWDAVFGVDQKETIIKKIKEELEQIEQFKSEKSQPLMNFIEHIFKSEDVIELNKVNQALEYLKSIKTY